MTTSQGQGSSTWATALSWSATNPEHRRARLIDADPAVGTIRTLLNVDGAASIENVFGSATVPVAALESQSIQVAQRHRLSVVPGFRRWEFRHAQVIGRIGPALAQLPDDVVIVDLGCPFEPSENGGTPATALLGAYFDAVFVVVRAQADLLNRAFRLLDAAPLARARLVVCRPPHRREMNRTLALLREYLPRYADPLEWDWDHSRVLKHDGQPAPIYRPGMLEETGLLGAGQLVAKKPQQRGLGRWRSSP